MDLNLENNKLKTLSDAVDLPESFANIQNLNLNGMVFADFETEIRALAALPKLRSLYANLQDED
jgi:hypothetical protein